MSTKQPMFTVWKRNQVAICEVISRAKMKTSTSGQNFNFHFAALPSPGPQNTLLGGTLDIQLTEIDRQRQGDRQRETETEGDRERNFYGGPLWVSPRSVIFHFRSRSIGEVRSYGDNCHWKVGLLLTVPERRVMSGRVGPHEDAAGRQSSSSREQSPHQEKNLLAPWSWLLSLQKHEK